jgi:hypothetical protein
MTPALVLLGAKKPARRLCSRALRMTDAILAPSREQNSLTSNLRSCPASLVGLALALLLIAAPAGAQPSAERDRFQTLQDSQPLVGRPYEYAKNTLEAKGFMLETRYSSSEPESLGKVVAAYFLMNPPHVVLSVGELRVPDFAQLRHGEPRLESLLLLLRNAGVRESTEIVEAQDPSLWGKCTYQYPDEGQRLRPGGSLMLRYALRAIAVPAVVEMTQAAAEQLLRDSGFVVQSYDTTVSRRAEFGRVVSTEPAAGQKLLPGRTVLLWVGRRPPAGWWLAVLITLLCLGALAAGFFLLRHRIPGLAGWFTQLVQRVQRVPAAPPPAIEIPGLTQQDVADLKSLLPTLKLNRGVVTRLEKEVFELRAEVRKLAERLEPEPAAAEVPERPGEVTKAYNEAIASSSPVGFLEQLKPVSVTLSGKRVVEPGVPPVLEFTESHAGWFLLVKDGNRWLLFPKQGLPSDRMTDIEQCFAVERGSQEPVNKNLVQFVRRPALCEPAKKGWTLKQKGHLFILGLPAIDELAD